MKQFIIKETDMILNRAKEHYKNDEERLRERDRERERQRERAKNKYRKLSEEEKK